MCKQNQSEEIKDLAVALNKVQQEDLFALTDKENPFFKSKYADLSSVWSVARKPLNENGLSVVQTMRVGERDNPIIVTTLLHESGQWIRGELEMPAPKKDPQQFGSAVTYGRRYSLAAMLGICPVDDDAQGATDSMKKEPKTTGKKSPKNSSEPKDFTKNLNATKKAKLYHVAGIAGIEGLELEQMCSAYAQGKTFDNDMASELIDNFDDALVAFHDGTM